MSETINIRQFIKSLDPDVRGVFEPLSGIMRIGMPQSEYQAAFERYAANASTIEDVALIGTINHETYHAMQAAVSGYCFDQQRRRFAVLNSLEELPDPAADAETQSLLATLRAEAGDDPDLKRRADRAEAVLLSHRAIEMLETRRSRETILFGARSIPASSAIRRTWRSVKQPATPMAFPFLVCSKVRPWLSLIN